MPQGAFQVEWSSNDRQEENSHQLEHMVQGHPQSKGNKTEDTQEATENPKKKSKKKRSMCEKSGKNKTKETKSFDHIDEI